MAYRIMLLILGSAAALYSTAQAAPELNQASNSTLTQDWLHTSPFRALSDLVRVGDADQMLKITKVFEIVSELISAERRTELSETLLDMSEANVDSFKANDDTCRLCTIAVTVMHEILDGKNLTDLMEPLMKICDVLMTNTSGIDNEERRHEICYGSITIQGPHVINVVSSNISADRICEFQNACNLPPLGETVGTRPSSKTDPSKLTSNSKPIQGSQSQPNLEAQGGPAAAPRGGRGLPSDGIARSQVERRPLSGAADRGDLSARKANALKIVQLTDIHIDVRYHEGSLADCELPICCLEEYGTGNAGHYGDYNCNIPPRTIELFLQKVASDIQPDLIVYTGDISGSRVWDETLEEILNCTLSLTDAITRTLPNVTVYPTMGNHEMYPTNLFYNGLSDVEYLMNHLTDWWSPIARFSPEQEVTFRTGAYYSILDLGTGIRIITYNSEFMYTNNWYNVFNFDLRSEASEMISFIETELALANSSNEKVILLGHHPPNSGDYVAVYANWYKNLVLLYKDILLLQLSGHRHNDNFHLIPDSEGNPVSMMYLGSAVTAGGTKNPAVRVYYIDNDSNEVIDYDQYYLNMKTEPSAGNAEIELLYSASSEYDLPDFSPQSWSNLVERMEYNETLFMTHYTHHFIDSRENLICNAGCKAQYFCNLRHITWQESSHCRDNYVPPTISTESTESTPSGIVSTEYTSGSTFVSTDGITEISTTMDLVVSSAMKFNSPRNSLITIICFYIAVFLNIFNHL